MNPWQHIPASAQDLIHVHEFARLLECFLSPPGFDNVLVVDGDKNEMHDDDDHSRDEPAFPEAS